MSKSDLRLPAGSAAPEYDPFANIYSRFIGRDFASRAFPAIEYLFLSRMPSGANLLDLCCGTGEIARMLHNLGFRVTGLDASERMLQHACRNAPEAQFFVADARRFNLPPIYAGVLSTFNSLAHFDSVADLKSVFTNVKKILTPKGLFLFDLSMQEAYESRWHGSFKLMDEENICIVHPAYDPQTFVGRNKISIYARKMGCKKPINSFFILQKCHSESDIRAALTAAEFTNVLAYDAHRDLGMKGEAGHMFFLCE